MSSLRLFVLILLCAACKNQGTAGPTGPQPVQWQAISPPRWDLECWQLYHKRPLDNSGTLIVQCWPVEAL